MKSNDAGGNDECKVFRWRHTGKLLSTLFCALPLLGTAQVNPAAVTAASPPPTYTIEQLLAITRRDSLVLQPARAQALGARAGVTTAGAYPNPEIEVIGASLRARQPGGISGEGPRVDPVRAENEVAIARVRVAEARAMSRLAVGIRLAENFTPAGDFYRTTPN